jgi:hypothetical protein
MILSSCSEAIVKKDCACEEIINTRKFTDTCVFDDVPYTGSCVKKGTYMRNEYSFEKGLFKSRTYFYNDEKKQFTEFKNGERSGLFLEWDEKVLKFHGNYTHDKLDGDFIVFDSTGKNISQIYVWKNGVEIDTLLSKR